MDNFEIYLSNEVAYITVSGSLDTVEASNRLRSTLEYTLAAPKLTAVILNLEKVDNIASYGISQLLLAHKQVIESPGTELKLHSVSGEVREALRLVMLDKFIKEDYSEWPS